MTPSPDPDDDAASWAPFGSYADADGAPAPLPDLPDADTPVAAAPAARSWQEVAADLAARSRIAEPQPDAGPLPDAPAALDPDPVDALPAPAPATAPPPTAAPPSASWAPPATSSPPAGPPPPSGAAASADAAAGKAFWRWPAPDPATGTPSAPPTGVGGRAADPPDATAQHAAAGTPPAVPRPPATRAAGASRVPGDWPPPRPTSTRSGHATQNTAKIALGLSIISWIVGPILAIVGMVMGYTVRRQSQDPTDRQLATAALGIGALQILVAVIGVAGVFGRLF